MFEDEDEKEIHPNNQPFNFSSFLKHSFGHSKGGGGRTSKETKEGS